MMTILYNSNTNQKLELLPNQDFSVIPSPLWTNCDLELIGTLLGLGLGGFGTKGLGTGLDYSSNCRPEYLF